MSISIVNSLIRIKLKWSLNNICEYNDKVEFRFQDLIYCSVQFNAVPRFLRDLFIITPNAFRRASNSLLDSFVRIPYLYFRRNQAAGYYYGWMSKHSRTHNDNNSLGHIPDTTENQKEKLNGRKIRTALLNRSVREILESIKHNKRRFGRAKNPEEQMRFARWILS